ncbi:hypothetical protein [Mucilaginibacter koreensis]
MHIAYLHPSLCTPGNAAFGRKNKKQNRLRQQAYQNVCRKYQHEIETIRQYHPGWTPRF